MEEVKIKRLIEIAQNTRETEVITDFMYKILNFSDVIMNDSFAIQHQTMGQYRSALIKIFTEKFTSYYKEKLKNLNNK